jgi:hypothetical protein
MAGCRADHQQARAQREAGAGGADLPRREAGAARQPPPRAAKPAAPTRQPWVEEPQTRHDGDRLPPAGAGLTPRRSRRRQISLGV